MGTPRLLLVSTEFPPGPGGIGTHAFQTARWLRQYGWDVRVRTCQDYVDRDIAEAFARNSGLQIRSLKGRSAPGTRLPYLAAGLWRDCSEWAPDVVMASGRNAVLAAWLAAKHARVVAVAHGTELLEGGALRNLLVRRAFRSAGLVIAVSRYTAEKLREIHAAGATVAVVPNGADEEAFHPATKEEVLAVRRELGVNEGPVILTVGRVSERKGQWVIARALAEVARQIPQVQYWVVGLPSERERLIDEARAAGVASQLRLFGSVPQEQLVRLIQACDLFAMTSVFTDNGDYEGYGIAVIEAALCGKPSVVSDCGGLPEAVMDGSTGLVVRQKDVEATAKALIRLLSDEDLRGRMGEQARQLALREGTWRARVKEYDRLIRQMAGR